MSIPRPAVDPELAAGLAQMPLVAAITDELLPVMRQYKVPAEAYIGDRPIERREVEIVAADGAVLPATVLRPMGASDAAPCIYWIHGGGMVLGDRFANLDIPLDWLAAFGAVVVTVDYRLAPEVSGMTLVEDCYSGLAWVAAHAGELGIDPARIVVAGISAGGGLAAGTVLLARDRGGPAIAAQVLVCPMLDHRNASVSSRQYSGEPGLWTRESNAFGWRAVLGKAREDIPAYVSPAVADDLSRLPTTYIDAGSAEVFRDEDAEYVSRIWAAGGQAELHIWAGGVHGFDGLFPSARVSAAARQARTDWLGRVLTAL
jgi:acetyl esterase/lipase